MFNGKDLSGFYTWLENSAYDDPDRVFSVVDQIDGAPAIRISGQHLGGLLTKAAYANYRLVAEFRWGDVTWAPRKDRARDSGIHLHCQGEDGNCNNPNFKSPWMRSIEFQIIEGGTGDLLLLPGYERGQPKQIMPQLTVAVSPGKRVWNPVGMPTPFNSGRLDWFGRDPQWRDAFGFRGAHDLEKPVGQWSVLEAVCVAGDVTVFVNGVKVNEGRNGSMRSGKILFQSEAAEIYFRRIELHPLGAMLKADSSPPSAFTALFNGRDLTGWRGGDTYDHRALLALSPEERAAQIKKWTDSMLAVNAKTGLPHWRAENHELVNDGFGSFATTERDYGDFELLVDYKTVPLADSGIYLRGVPQVQIWDFTQPDPRAKGSGGLWNNADDSPGKNPRLCADKPFGEWNHFRILLVGNCVSVWLNDQQVVDNAVLENYYDRKLAANLRRPIPERGPIQLQTHGGEIRWRNIFVREIIPAGVR